jgi:diacylglycerol kinase (ATP)
VLILPYSWGAGCNPWGPERDDVFSKPTHWDGMLEVVGVTGVVHLGQMQSGLRSGIRIAQGGHVSNRRANDQRVVLDKKMWKNGRERAQKGHRKAKVNFRRF